MKFDAELKFEDAVIQNRIGIFLETDIHLISQEDDQNNHVHSKWKFRCNVCRCIVTGIYGAQNHMESQRHKQNVVYSKTGEGSFIESKDKAKNENVPMGNWNADKNEDNATCLDSDKKVDSTDSKKTSITDNDIMVVPLPGKTQVPKAAYPYLTMQEKLKSLVEPIVGLERVIEHHIETGEMPPYYECQLCKSDMADANLINHLKGRCHRMNYIQMKNLEKYSSISSLASYNVGKAMLDTIKDMEQEYGRGFMPIIIDKDVSRHPDSKNYQLLRERMKENEKAVSQKRGFGSLENTSNNKERKKKRGIIGKIDNKGHLSVIKGSVMNSDLNQQPTGQNSTTYNSWPLHNVNNTNINTIYPYPNTQGWMQEQMYYYQNQYYQSYVTPPPINPELCPVTLNLENLGQTGQPVISQGLTENKILQGNSDNLPLLGTAPALTPTYNNDPCLMNFNSSMGPMNNSMMSPMNNNMMSPMNNNMMSPMNNNMMSPMNNSMMGPMTGPINNYNILNSTNSNMSTSMGPGPLNNSNMNSNTMGFVHNNVMMGSMNNNSMMASINNNSMMASINNNSMMGTMNNVGMTHNYVTNDVECANSSMMASSSNLGLINKNIMCAANDIGSVNNVIVPMNNSGPVNNNTIGSIRNIKSVNRTDFMNSTNNPSMMETRNMETNQNVMSSMSSNNRESVSHFGQNNVGPFTQSSTNSFPMIQNANNSKNSNSNNVPASLTSQCNNLDTEQKNIELLNSTISGTTKFEFKPGIIDTKLVQGLLNDNLNAQIKEVINTLKQPSVIQTLVSSDKSETTTNNYFLNQDAIVSYTTQGSMYPNNSIDKSIAKTPKKQSSSPFVNEIDTSKNLKAPDPLLVANNSNESFTPPVNYLTVTSSTTTDTSNPRVKEITSESVLEQSPVHILQNELAMTEAEKESLSETPLIRPSTQYNFRCIEESIPLLGSDGKISLSESGTILAENDNQNGQVEITIESGMCKQLSKGSKSQSTLSEVSVEISKPEASDHLPTKESQNQTISIATSGKKEANESIATAEEIRNQRGVLLEALGSWEIKTEEEASAAVKVITRLTQSLKQYKLKSGQAGVKNVS